MKKISRRSFLTVVGAAAATAALTACGGSSSSTAASTSSAASTAAPAATASNASVVLKFDLTVSLEHPWGLAATEFKNRIEEKSGGSMTVEIYPSSTSGSEADSLAGMLVGTTSMTMSGGSFNGYAPSATLLEAPWAYNSEEDVQAMCESDIGKGIMQDFEDAGFKVLWYQLRGPRELTSNVPINKASDLQGRKMRMSGNVLHNSMWTAAGAITSAIALSETFNALSLGVVEMQENPYDMINAKELTILGTRHQYQKFPEVVKILPDHLKEVDEITTHVFKAEDFQKAFDTLADRNSGAGKVVLTFA